MRKYGSTTFDNNQYMFYFCFGFVKLTLNVHPTNKFLCPYYFLMSPFQSNLEDSGMYVNNYTELTQFLKHLDF